MKSFFFALIALLLLVGLILLYRVSLTSFAKALLAELERLPSTAQEWENTEFSVAERCETLLSLFREKELLIHLALPYERVESLHEKLIGLTESARTEAMHDFFLYRALCLEETEILKTFEEISLVNLI